MVKKQRLQDDEYEVEKIVQRRTEGGRVLYQVKWKGYREEESTWEPSEHLKGCQELVDAYERSHPVSQVAKKCAHGQGKRGRVKETLEMEDWSLIQDSETRPKLSPKKPTKKPKAGVLGIDKPLLIVRKWREDGELKFELSWEAKGSHLLANSEVKLEELREKEPKMLIDYLLKELR